MRLDLVQPIRTDRATAYRTMWNRFTELPAHLPNVASITEISRQEQGDDRVHTVHRWSGDPAVIPVPLRKIAPANLLDWDGHANWYHDQTRVEFEFLAAHFQGLYRCTGGFAVQENSQHCSVRIQANLEIYGDKLPGIPKVLGRSVGKKIEGIIVHIIDPSLRALPAAVEAFL